jgi:DNA-directed RNA polymerase subunit RPC12/RpoP
MRAMTQPPPSSRCSKCGGELRLKLIEAGDRGLDLENEIFVCANCGREQSLTVSHDHKMPHTKVA